MGEGNPKRALMLFKRARKAGFSDVALLMARMGDAHRILRNFEEAGECYYAALNENPDCVGALHGLGRLLFTMRNCTGAQIFLRRAAELQPDSHKIRYHLANAQRQAGNIEAAIENYRVAIGREPNNSYYHYDFGVALWKARKHEDAMVAFKAAISIDRNNFLAHEDLAELLFKAGMFEDALKHILIVEGHVGQMGIASEGYNNHAYSVYYKLGQYWTRVEDETQLKYFYAIEAFEKALEFKADDALAYAAIAFCCSHLGDREYAIEGYSRAIELMPERESFYRALATLFSFMHEYGKAAEVLEQLALQGREDEQLHYEMGILFEKQDDFISAIKHFEKALEINPKSSAAEKRLERLRDRHALRISRARSKMQDALENQASSSSL